MCNSGVFHFSRDVTHNVTIQLSSDLGPTIFLSLIHHLAFSICNAMTAAASTAEDSRTYQRHGNCTNVTLTPPVFKLDRDLLWLIFARSAQMEVDLDSEEIFSAEIFPLSASPLVVLRYSSHVCSAWREIILSSPSLWGQIIDLGGLTQRSNDWRRAVLERSQQSLLSIQGIIYAGPRHALHRSFFLGLIADEWERIRHLQVTICVQESMDCNAWNSLWRPSLTLEKFALAVVTPKGARIHIPNKPDQTFFSNVAPRLRTFDLRTYVSINLKAPWVSQLRRLGISSACTLDELFSALSEMEFLEELSVENVREPKEDVFFPSFHIKLPLLKQLAIHQSISICLDILDSIVPAEGCRIRIKSFNSNLHNFLSLRKPLCGVLNRYTKEYLNANSPSTLSLVLDNQSACLQIYDKCLSLGTSKSIPDPTSPQFSISVHSIMSSFRPCMFAAFARILKGCSMQDFIKFKLRIFGRPFEEYDPDFIHIILSLFSVIELEATTEALALLYGMQRDAPIFPVLKTLKIDNFTKVNPIVIAEFLVGMINNNTPIDNLDLTLLEPQDLGVIKSLHHLVPDVKVAGCP